MPSVFSDRDGQPEPRALDDAEFQSLSEKYKAAAETYQTIVKNHADLIAGGGAPSQEKLREEEDAWAALDAARFALLSAVERTLASVH